MLSPSSAIRTLTRLRGDFSTDAVLQQLASLKSLAPAARTTSRQLSVLHRELLFLNAFPPNQAIWRASRVLLNTFYRRVPRASGSRKALMDSGIAGTTSQHTFMFGTIRWLLSHGDNLEPLWDASAHDDALAALIRPALLPAEWDAFDSSTLSTTEWLRRAAGLRARDGGLAWLLRGASTSTTREAYDAVELPVSWHMGNSARATTNNRAPVGRPVLRRSFRRLPRDPLALINTYSGSIRRLSVESAEPWIDCCRAALAARCREVAATMYSNTGEVYLGDLGEGCSICIIGAHPHDRLALEANYGYVMFSNGIPVGYGGVTPLADQANTGANIFEEFRGSEAPVLFAHALGVFRRLFDVSRFVVNPYQFGADNDEALLSGAFWFYDRLGFRAAQGSVRRAVRAERRRLQQGSRQRSSLRTLKSFAKSDLVLEVTAESPIPLFKESYLETIGDLVTASLRGIHAADRHAHVLREAHQLKRMLIRDARSLTAVEQRGALLLAPVIALIYDAIHGWSRADQSRLWALLRAKGTVAERQFVQLSREHMAFWEALRQRCVRGARGSM